jgi:2,3-bisphosphoglycerate-independent phosphoglycerate mutase
MPLNKLLLIILDGWGITQVPNNSAIYKADTKNFDKLMKSNPNAALSASEMHVGLPKGQMGNSEVGHMTIGAGRIIKQPLVEINDIIAKRELANNRVINESFKYAVENGKKVHFIGLLSDGGIHSHINHLKELCVMARDYSLCNVFIHAFTDGRDTAEKSAIDFISELEECIKNSVGKIASVIGRYYAMDRDNNWDRTKIAYDAMVHGIGKRAKDIHTEIRYSYSKDIKDEFVKPIVIVDEHNEPIGNIEDGDVVICFNFRKDRCRQITMALTQVAMPNYGMYPLSLKYSTFTNYDSSFIGVDVIFDLNNVRHTLGEVISLNGRTQTRIAETEKYPHVTYFFSGGREAPFDGETRILCPSPQVATYDLMPEMAAWEIKDRTIETLQKATSDFTCVNFANADMVGHTGNMQATIEACQVVDKCLGELVTKATQCNYIVIVTSDHGNAENMLTSNNEPCTTHSTNQVPFILINSAHTRISPYGKLSDIAPTILHLMRLPLPNEMDGKSLIIS